MTREHGTVAKKKTPAKSGSTKKSTVSSADRKDPTKNKSLAVRNVVAKMPNAKAAVVAESVKKEYGHEVATSQVYMIKTKMNMAKDGRAKPARGAAVTPMNNSSALWIDAIKTARKLLKATGSVANAKALLEAVEA